MLETYGLIEATGVLNCSPEWVRQLAKSGKLRGIKVGQRWVFKEIWLDEYMDRLAEEEA